ncbi:craniofacial development protein 2-like [Penaeus vannamei]|uniref:craniofacial development protein 2-like n=1 Tax=Penaeus vannamei TaxID=6689 RepID=UPI00387F9C80
MDSFYEDVHLASERVKIHSTAILGDFNAKIGKNTGETVVGNHGIGTRNERGQVLVDFAEAQSLNIMNAFFRDYDIDLNIYQIKKQFNDMIKKAALEVGGTSMKAAKRRLGIGRNQIYAIKKTDGEVTYNKNEIIRLSQRYNSNEQPQIEADVTTTINLYGNKIPIKKCVRQGDTISLKLFTACLEKIFKKLDWNEQGIKIAVDYLNNLRFRDDIVLFSESAN